MKIKLECPYAYHGQGMGVYCKITEKDCYFQQFKPCKGWWVNSPGAKGCLRRKKEEENGKG